MRSFELFVTVRQASYVREVQSNLSQNSSEGSVDIRVNFQSAMQGSGFFAHCHQAMLSMLFAIV